MLHSSEDPELDGSPPRTPPRGGALGPPASLAHSASTNTLSWEKPFESHWQRISIVMLLMSIIQCFASIYIFLYASESATSRHVVFYGFLAYCLISLICMVFRSKYGLLWFGLGSLLYAIWLSVLTWESVEEKDYTRVCFDFSLAAFEFLVFCLAISRFHELRGFVLCCGEPSHDWKGRLLVGEGTARRRPGPEDADEDFEQSHYHHGGVGLFTNNEPEEGERYLNQNLLANQYFHGSGTSGSHLPQAQQQGAQVVPRRGLNAPMEDTGSPGEDMFPDGASVISSASSSYNRTSVGRGELLYAVPRQQHQQFHQPQTIFDNSFKLAAVIPEQRSIQLHQQQQREALSRDPSFSFAHQ